MKGNATFSSFLDTDKTYINGGKIATGSITADKLSVDDLSAFNAKIGGFSIDNHRITSQIDDNDKKYICMDYKSNSLISKSDSYTAKLNSGALRFFNEEKELAVYQANKWSNTDIWGTCVHSSVDSKFVTFGNLKTPSSQHYETVLLLNYGLNPDGITNDVIVYGDSCFMDRAQFKNGIEFINAVDNTRTVFKTYNGGGVGTTNCFGVKAIYNNYTFSVDGNGYASSGFTSGSDKRLKHNIEKMTDDFEKIVDFLSPSSYVYNSSTNEKKHLGFIAQEVQQAFFNCNINPNDYEIVNDRGDGMLSLTYDDLISILWKVCQSLRKDNKEIKRQLSSLQNQISSQGLAIQQQSLDNQLVI